VIGSHINKFSGETFVSQETIAQEMGVCERTAHTAIKEIEQKGYLIIKRRELGIINRRKKDGTTMQIRAAGGRGIANIYVPAIDRTELRAQKLASRCELEEAKRSQKGTRKVAADCDPTLTSPSEKNPPVAIGHESEPIDKFLFNIFSQLERRIGTACFMSWFNDIQIDEKSDRVVTFSAPNSFKASRIFRDYENDLLYCCRSAQPSIERVKIIARQQQNGMISVT
jgi:hypothetical protein